jgi:hypothetical protein
MFAKSRANSFGKPRQLGIESLEKRELMAGDVTAYVQYGNLYINEAAKQVGMDNAIQITRLDNGQIRVAGTTAWEMEARAWSTARRIRISR